MSIKTLRKRTALTVITGLTAATLSVVSAPVAQAGGAGVVATSHPNVGTANIDPVVSSSINGHLMVATATNNGPVAVVTSTATGASALSKGLLNKDSSSSTAQTATVLAGGALSLYAYVSTAVTFTATGGTLSSVNTYSGGFATAAYTVLYNSTNTASVIQNNQAITAAGNSATAVGAIWTAPTTAGTYTLTMSTGWPVSSGVNVVPTLTTPSSTLAGQITVSVVATSAGGSYDSSKSACKVDTAGAAISYSSSSPAVDTTAIFTKDSAAYINFDLNDAYTQNLASGVLVATATNGALLNMGAGGSLTVGTGSTAIYNEAGVSDTVRIDQPTSGNPLTTTVTISYNGTTVCTKTVTIRGAVAKLTVANVGTQNLDGVGSATTSNGNQWMYQKTQLFTAGLFTVVATDSAGNIVSTPSDLGTYSAASGTGVQVPAISVISRSSTAVATTPLVYNYGSWSCGSTAGESQVTIRFTTTATGKSVVSDPFKARCAGNASTYTASLDKASYIQGDIAKATVKFFDSKGNPANNVTAVGANTWVLPYMTGVDFTVANGASSTAVSDANGEIVYTFTVGATTAAVAGTYTGIIEYSVPALGVKSTPTYKLSTGGDTTTNADVLKSIVALIASINKQIQALQKLILKR